LRYCSIGGGGLPYATLASAKTVQENQCLQEGWKKGEKKVVNNYVRNEGGAEWFRRRRGKKGEETGASLNEWKKTETLWRGDSEGEKEGP